tara:strand:- start:2008 stop:2991 length:984 start_codon:yes stop_codon:yes gene_type:complete
MISESLKKDIEAIFCDPLNLNGSLKFKWDNSNNLITLYNKKRKFYSVIDNVISFEEGKNYTDNFGDQWLRFNKTQLDSYNKTRISENRFFLSTGWNKNLLKDKLLLDIGCGSGRFSEIALKYGAKVIAVDLSDAVYAANKNFRDNQNFLVIKCDISKLPFIKESFDYILCLGVLQHTEQVEKSFKGLVKFLKKEGKICADFYPKDIFALLSLKYIIRIITRKLDNKKLYNIIYKSHPLLYKISDSLSRVPILGFLLKRIIPIANYRNVYNLNENQLKEWSLLDTYDMLAAKYDYPQNKSTVMNWAKEKKLKKIKIFRKGHLILRAQK